MAATTVRQRILAYIRQWGPIDAEGIGRGLHLSAATVRHHLGILVSDGRVVSDSTLRSGRLQGRPRKLYRLSDGMWGDNLAMLSNVLFDLWHQANRSSDDARTDLMAMADGLRQRMGPIDGRQSATKRLEQLIEQLNAANYEAHWEAGADGPRVIFARCPYAEIIDDRPYLCSVDAYMLEAAMNADEASPLALNRRKDAERSNRCVFALYRVRKGRG